MTRPDKDMIHYLTQLSHIHCTEDEQESLMNDLGEMLDYVEKLQEVDTEKVSPCHHVLEDFTNVMREDEVGETLSRETFLKNAPSHIGGMIRVPPVIKGK